MLRYQLLTTSVPSFRYYIWLPSIYIGRAFQLSISDYPVHQEFARGKYISSFRMTEGQLNKIQKFLNIFFIAGVIQHVHAKTPCKGNYHLICGQVTLQQTRFYNLIWNYGCLVCSVKCCSVSKLHCTPFKGSHNIRRMGMHLSVLYRNYFWCCVWCCPYRFNFSLRLTN